MLSDVWSLNGRYRTLHLTWFAFFLADLGLSVAQIRTVAICNVALTIPARVLIGMLLDKFGPRKTYSTILIFSVVPCLLFASAQDFNQLVIARLLLSIVGAGFVIGIRMVSEWFPPKEIGLAEGIYGGWGNFGSAFSALSLVAVAGFLSFSGGFELPTGAVLNWRGAIALTGIISFVYGIIYFFSVTDTPPGKPYQRPAKTAGLEVTSIRDFWGLIGMNVPFAAILSVLCWRLQKVGFLTSSTYPIALIAVLAWFIFQTWGIIRTNIELLNGTKIYPKEDRYEFKQVAKAVAGILASCYAFVNLIARPAGGLISDRTGNRKNTMGFLTMGLGFGYLLMSLIKPGTFTGSAGILMAVKKE